MWVKVCPLLSFWKLLFVELYEYEYSMQVYTAQVCVWWYRRYLYFPLNVFQAGHTQYKYKEDSKEEEGSLVLVSKLLKVWNQSTWNSSHSVPLTFTLTKRTVQFDRWLALSLLWFKLLPLALGLRPGLQQSWCWGHWGHIYSWCTVLQIFQRLINERSKREIIKKDNKAVY